MDDVLAYWLTEEFEETEEAVRMHNLRAAALATAVTIAVQEEFTAAEAAARRAHRAYLRRVDLIPNPRGETPWQRMYDVHNDEAFIATMGLDVKTFMCILDGGFAERWNTHTIPRSDVVTSAVPRPERRSLDAAGGLGLILHYLSSTMLEITLQQIFALVPTTVSRYLDFALEILLHTLRKMKDAAILWPCGEEFQEFAEMIQARHPLLWGAFGSIDGLNLPCQTSSDPLIENATYNGWLHEHFISCVFVFSPKGTIIAAKVNCPGSWHDSRVAQPIYEKLRTQTPDGYYLVADTAFPRGTDQISGKIRAPLKTGDTRSVRNNQEREELLAYDANLVSFRQTAEWGMRALQGAFGRLRVLLEIENDVRRANLLETCARLHNIRTNMIGIGEIRKVYEPVWKEGDLQELWNGFEDVVFAELRKHDRVTKFYHDVQEK